MKIVRATWAPFRIPFRTPYETAHGRALERTGYIVAVEQEDGSVGVGEASMDPSAPRAADGILGLHVESIARALIGLEEEDAEAVLERFRDGDEASRAAHCGIETALFDASTRSFGIPLAMILTGDPEGMPAAAPARMSVPVNATIASGGTEDAVAAARRAVEAGFSCVKLKVGMGESIGDEVERVQAVREAIGPETRLRLDANGAWDEPTAVATLSALKTFDLELVEQPVAPGDVEALARVQAAVEVPVMADEGASSEDEAGNALLHGLGVVLKPARLGGGTVVRFLADLAQEVGEPAIVTTTIDTGIGTALALQVAAALPGAELAHGLATASLLEHDLLEAPLEVENGYMKLPLEPGLGIKFDKDAAEKYVGRWQRV